MDEVNSGDSKIWRIVLDVLKPHDPSLPQFAENLAALEGVEDVDVALVEIDKETETLKVTIDGQLDDYSKLKSEVENGGGVVHSVDEVVAGESH